MRIKLNPRCGAIAHRPTAKACTPVMRGKESVHAAMAFASLCCEDCASRRTIALGAHGRTPLAADNLPGAVVAHGIEGRAMLARKERRSKEGRQEGKKRKASTSKTRKQRGKEGNRGGRSEEERKQAWKQGSKETRKPGRKGGNKEREAGTWKERRKGSKIKKSRKEGIQ